MKILVMILSLLSVIFGHVSCSEVKLIKPNYCVGCALQSGEFKGFGELIASTQYFEVRQDCYLLIPGFMVISSKRHVQSIDDFTQEERHDFIDFVYKIRRHMREILNIDTVYLIQEEDSKHFHLWVFPRYEWMEEKFGTGIRSVKPIMQWAQEHLDTTDNLNQVLDFIKQLKQSLEVFIV